MNIIRLSYVDSFDHFKVNNVRIVRIPFLTCPFLFKVQPLWREYFVIKTSRTWTIWIVVRCCHVHSIIYFVLSFNLIQNYMTGYSYVDSVMRIYWIRIFNFSIKFMALRMYIILNFYCTILQCDCATGQHTALSQMGPYMASVICRQRKNWEWLISLTIQLSSLTLVVVVRSFNILVNSILIILRLLLLMY